MYLSDVKIEGFRCFKNCRFKFQPGFNVVVGRNNTGKTNIFNAIRHALGPSANRGDLLWPIEDDFFHDGTERVERIVIELTFKRLSPEDRARFFELLDYNPEAPDQSVARLVFEASWPTVKRYAEIRRWCGAPIGDRATAPPEVLAQLPVTFLPALRDAEAALTPGNRSRLAHLLQDLARRDKSTPADKIEGIFREANSKLEQENLLHVVRSALRASRNEMAGTDYAPCSITASPPRLDRILRTLRVQMDEAPIEDISANGLGYNNLLYVATILAHLEHVGTDETPLLLVEEPEAHLHPQLTVLLAEYLNTLTEKGKPPQVIVTTHSPTLAAHVAPSKVAVTYFDANSRTFRCNSLASAGLAPEEERQLRRMMDVTRATLYFAKGLILVEGISEALLVPVLASRLRCELLSRHISVLPICGVAFGTFEKLFTEKGVNIPVSIITDGDPSKSSADWKTAVPEQENGSFLRSRRTAALLEKFKGRQKVRVFASTVTLEYDLAAAATANAALMVETWESCFKGAPQTLNKALLAQAGNDLTKQALAVWRGICLAETAGSKAEFANKLADMLSDTEGSVASIRPFQIPRYLTEAIKFVWDALEPQTVGDKGATTA